ncbi:MAG: hypothetical protein EXR69_10075 [Myxococcales bacterium]|nr:hypothetical protein [Myxococcales bacterium]
MPLADRILAGRGLVGPDAAEFLNPGRHHLLDPAGLLGMDRALDRLERALAEGEHLRLVTDYDADGTTSCLILHAALDRRIATRSGSPGSGTNGGPRVSYHIPDRMTEGYGLSERAVRAAASDGARLIVTADIGVRDHATVSLARSLGVDVVVLDHHLPAGETVPADAVAVVCPPQPGCTYANKALAACGVSTKLATALLANDPRRDTFLPSLWKLAAIGTVADIVDLSTLENRALVALGLAELNRGPHGAGLSALLSVAGAKPGQITAHTLGFMVGPRINAAGRLKDANAIVELLRLRDPVEAMTQARAINELNLERREIQAQMVEQSQAMVARAMEQDGVRKAFIVVGGREDEGWHRGVNGIVAARIRDEFHRPCAVLSVSGELVTGSVRSVPRVHAVKALDAVSDLLVRYGGHPVAAGFSLRAADLDAFTSRLDAFVRAHHDDEALIPVEEYDVEADPRECTMAAVRQLDALGPCGKGNPDPRVVVSGPIQNVKIVKDRFVFGRIGPLPFVWWDGVAPMKSAGPRAALLGRLEIAEDRGLEGVRLVVSDGRDTA